LAENIPIFVTAAKNKNIYIETLGLANLFKQLDPNVLPPSRQPVHAKHE